MKNEEWRAKTKSERNKSRNHDPKNKSKRKGTRVNEQMIKSERKSSWTCKHETKKKQMQVGPKLKINKNVIIKIKRQESLSE